ncbi:MAG: hypothetical protein ACXVJ0_09975, partial [Candidatus Angelobacter sp.]
FAKAGVTEAGIIEVGVVRRLRCWPIVEHFRITSDCRSLAPGAQAAENPWKELCFSANLAAGR